MINRITLFRTTKRILFGAGSLEKIGTEAQLLKAKKALIVTDPGIVQAGLITPLKNPWRRPGCPWPSLTGSSRIPG